MCRMGLARLQPLVVPSTLERPRSMTEYSLPIVAGAGDTTRPSTAESDTFVSAPGGTWRYKVAVNDHAQLDCTSLCMELACTRRTMGRVPRTVTASTRNIATTRKLAPPKHRVVSTTTGQCSEIVVCRQPGLFTIGRNLPVCAPYCRRGEVRDHIQSYPCPAQGLTLQGVDRRVNSVSTVNTFALQMPECLADRGISETILLPQLWTCGLLRFLQTYIPCSVHIGCPHPFLISIFNLIREVDREQRRILGADLGVTSDYGGRCEERQGW